MSPFKDTNELSRRLSIRQRIDSIQYTAAFFSYTFRASELTPVSSQAAILSVSPKPHLLASFWTHLITNNDTFSTPEAQSRLSDRLRDFLLKQITLIGAPQVLSGLIPLAKAQTEIQGSEEGAKQDIERW